MVAFLATRRTVGAMVSSRTHCLGSGTLRNGVTLYELLIVIAVIMVLAALVMPAMSMIRGKARQSQCCNNLRQLGAATHVYASINGGVLPSSRNWGNQPAARSIAWFHRLPPLMSARTTKQHQVSFFQCPLYNGQSDNVFGHDVPKSYKMNQYIDTVRNRVYVPFSFDTITDATSVVLFTDGKTHGGTAQWGRLTANGVDDSRHLGWVGVLYADGHSASARERTSAGWKAALLWKSADWE